MCVAVELMADGGSCQGSQSGFASAYGAGAVNGTVSLQGSGFSRF